MTPVNAKAVTRGSVFCLGHDEDIRRITARLLESKGFDVSIAVSSGDLLEAVEVGSHDVIIAVVRGPTRRGLSVLYQLMQDNASAAVMIVAGFDLLAKTLARGELIDLVRCVSPARTDGEGTATELRSHSRSGKGNGCKRIEAVVQAIRNDPAAVPQIHRLAADVGLGVSRFRHLFRETVGVSFRQFVCASRLDEAARQLINSDGRVSAIAYGVGFEDLSYFDRVFRQRFGTSPKEHRAHYR